MSAVWNCLSGMCFTVCSLCQQPVHVFHILMFFAVSVNCIFIAISVHFRTKKTFFGLFTRASSPEFTTYDVRRLYK